MSPFSSHDSVGFLYYKTKPEFQHAYTINFHQILIMYGHTVHSETPDKNLQRVLTRQNSSFWRFASIWDFPGVSLPTFHTHTFPVLTPEYRRGNWSVLKFKPLPSGVFQLCRAQLKLCLFPGQTVQYKWVLDSWVQAQVWGWGADPAWCLWCSCLSWKSTSSFSPKIFFVQNDLMDATQTPEPWCFRGNPVWHFIYPNQNPWVCKAGLQLSAGPYKNTVQFMSCGNMDLMWTKMDCWCSSIPLGFQQ